MTNPQAVTKETILSTLHSRVLKDMEDASKHCTFVEITGVLQAILYQMHFDFNIAMLKEESREV